MQNVSFKIGTDQHRDLKGASTTYKQTISEHSNQFKHYLQNRSSSHIGAKDTSVKLGNGQKVDYISEQKEKYTPQKSSGDGGTNKVLAKQLRQDHFTLEEATGGDKKPNYYETVNHRDFNYKGDARNIRSFIPPEVTVN